MNSQELQLWNQARPVGTSVLANLPQGYNGGEPLSTKTRSTAFFHNGTPMVLVAGISTAIPIADISDVKTGPKFPLQLTTHAFDEEHLKAIRAAVDSVNAENVDLHIEHEEHEGNGSCWVTISGSSSNRIFHLGARVGKWLVEEKGGLAS